MNGLAFLAKTLRLLRILGAVRVCFFVRLSVCVGGIRTAQNLLYTIHQMSVCLSLHGKSYTV